MTKLKIKQLITWQRIVSVTILVFLIILSSSGPIFAQAFTQTYRSDSPLNKGMVVQLVKEDTSRVKPVNTQSIDQMYGVVVDSNDAPVALISEGSKISVATNGPFEVLVSDQNGPIQPNDYLTISSIEGVAMKAGSAEPVVVGRALVGFDGKTNVIGKATVTDTKGVKKEVSFARVNSDISVSRNPNQKGEAPNVPEFLRKATEAIAGKPVPTIRIYLAIFIFLASVIVSGSLMYAGIRNGLISIGRNPLGKKTIVRGMFQVIITGLIIFILGIFGVYLLLKL
ncbi:MAG: hypothetical protein U0451_00140 [Candidatus Saccharimonadales bacterium]